VPRVPSRTRLDAVATAATAVFGRLGYQRTKTADVAKAAGMSTGSLFTYVQTKEALFHLVFVHGFGLLGESMPSLPFATPAAGETLALIERELPKLPVPRLQAATKTAHPDDVMDEVRGVIEERYEMLERLWPILAVIERCASEFPDLEAFFFGRLRVGYHHRLARYLDARSAAGDIRELSDAATTARLISESIAWFAWHRREGRDARDYDDDVARRTVIEFVCASLVPER
jgi:AcrR family transcriptional regulator